MDESFAGFRVRGGWVDIVEHGERITRALRDEGVPDERLERWAEWRPKAHERLGEDVEEKTAEQGVTAESDGDDSDADESPVPVENTAHAVDSVGRKALRAAERAVYQTVMRKTAPYYFNADLLTASIERTRNADNPYVFEVSIKDQDLKERVSERLSSYDTELERWHIDTEKRTEGAEAAEGAEPTEAETKRGTESDIDTDFDTT